jgi:hypothetical protein
LIVVRNVDGIAPADVGIDVRERFPPAAWRSPRPPPHVLLHVVDAVLKAHNCREGRADEGAENGRHVNFQNALIRFIVRRSCWIACARSAKARACSPTARFS